MFRSHRGGTAQPEDGARLARATLQDAGLRDRPLHALRHTAATARPASAQPLIFAQRQLGHRSITTTEEHHAHLEASFVCDAAARTEATIASALRLVSVAVTERARPPERPRLDVRPASPFR